MQENALSHNLGHKVLFALLISCTAWSVWSTVQRRAAVPSRETWSLASHYIKENLIEGDFVTWYPEWAGESRLSLHGLPVIPLAQQGEVDFAQAKRLWVLGAFDRDGVHLQNSSKYQIVQNLGLISKKVFQAQDSGPVSLSLMKIKGPINLHNLYDDLPNPNRVSFSRLHGKPRAKSPAKPMPKQNCDFWALNGWHCTPQSPRLRQRASKCLARPQAEQLKKRSRRRDLYTLDRRRWLPYIDCRLHPTEHLSQDWRVIDESPKRCISAMPHQGHIAQVAWWVPVESNQTELWFKYGWEDLALRHPFRDSKAQAIKVQIQQAGQKIFTATLQPQLGWFTKKFPISPPTDLVGPPAPYLFTYEATQGIDDANFCFSMSIRKQGGH